MFGKSHSIRRISSGVATGAGGRTGPGRLLVGVALLDTVCARRKAFGDSPHRLTQATSGRLHSQFSSSPLCSTVIICPTSSVSYIYYVTCIPTTGARRFLSHTADNPHSNLYLMYRTWPRSPGRDLLGCRECYDLGHLTSRQSGDVLNGGRVTVSAGVQESRGEESTPLLE
jgi:hypothetical protein